jgi:hypothetical protein
MRCSRTARGFGFGSSTVFAAAREHVTVPTNLNAATGLLMEGHSTHVNLIENVVVPVHNTKPDRHSGSSLGGRGRWFSRPSGACLNAFFCGFLRGGQEL